MKHTPGPWKIFNAWNAADGVIAFSSMGNDERKVIRSESTQTDIYATNEADLHLIAAAPELLEALEEMLKYFGFSELELEQHEAFLNRNRVRVSKQAHTAIAKAKGES